MQNLIPLHKNSRIKHVSKIKNQKRDIPSVNARRNIAQSIHPQPFDWRSLVVGHLGLATTLAKEYKNIPGVDFDDILQQARIGLTRAAMRFDASKGTAFSTFAWRVIQNDLNTYYTQQRKRFLREKSMFEDHHRDSTEE